MDQPAINRPRARLPICGKPRLPGSPAPGWKLFPVGNGNGRLFLPRCLAPVPHPSRALAPGGRSLGLDSFVDHGQGSPPRPSRNRRKFGISVGRPPESRGPAPPGGLAGGDFLSPGSPRARPYPPRGAAGHGSPTFPSRRARGPADRRAGGPGPPGAAARPGSPSRGLRAGQRRGPGRAAFRPGHRNTHPAPRGAASSSSAALGRRRLTPPGRPRPRGPGPAGCAPRLRAPPPPPPPPPPPAGPGRAAGPPRASSPAVGGRAAGGRTCGPPRAGRSERGPRADEEAAAGGARGRARRRTGLTALRRGAAVPRAPQRPLLPVRAEPASHSLTRRQACASVRPRGEPPAASARPEGRPPPGATRQTWWPRSGAGRAVAPATPESLGLATAREAPGAGPGPRPLGPFNTIGLAYRETREQ
ncbi:basic proline-rich protein-like [Delphinapterus leucas]|uniref:Basic proline-rich protein-like n=1 Tax=Delphinapterus leucas TaxID=9749 RepID=A0A2Y9QDH6_DELLE|nr:basic proline-rich protein-like [Delphinapterus leucas]